MKHRSSILLILAAAAFAFAFAFACASSTPKDGQQPAQGDQTQATASHASHGADDPCEGGMQHTSKEGEAPLAFDAAPAVGTQAKCPVSGEIFTVADNTVRAEQGGKHYVFCCPKCSKLFSENPGQYTAK